ncbi:hypothetical protein V6N13_090311 [Hibiscus sabdariffa]
MSFSSSHGSVKNKSGEVECYCRAKAHVCVSNTGKNHRRLFYGCGKYKEGEDVTFLNGLIHLNSLKFNLKMGMKRWKRRNKIYCPKSREQGMKSLA